MQRSSLSSRLLRAGAALLLSTCGAAALAQSTEAVPVEGTSINLIVPAGYCKLTRDAEPGRTMYGMQDRMQTGTNLVLLIYADCGELAQVKKGAAQTLPHYGMYLSPNPGGHVAKLPSTMSRAAGIEEVAKAVPALDQAALEKSSNARAGAEGLSFNKAVTGLLGKDANAAYIGIAANVSNGSQSARFQAVAAMTFLKGIGVSSNLYSPPETGAPFARLWAAQKVQAAALVKAN